MDLLTVRFAQLQHDVGLGLSLLLHVASLGRDLVDVDDESGHGFSVGLGWIDLLIGFMNDDADRPRREHKKIFRFFAACGFRAVKISWDTDCFDPY